MILITGVAGFIGSHLARYFVEQGQNVLGIDDLSTGHIEAVPSGLVFEKIDLSNTNDVLKLENYGKFTSIFHIAGQSGGEPSYDNPLRDLESNTASTLNLLRLAMRNEYCTFNYASTVSVYGDNGRVQMLTETDDCKPISFYGVGKLASENYMRIYANQFGVKTRALRLFNIYGPGQDLKNLRQGMVSIYVGQAVHNGHIHVKGSPDRFRDFVYIDDAIEAFVLADRLLDPGHVVYNISTTQKTSVGELCELIRDQIPNVTIEYQGSTPGDIHGYTGDNRAAQSGLGWQPKIGISEGVNNMIKWALGYKENV